MRKPTAYIAAVRRQRAGLLAAGPTVAAGLSDITKQNLETAMHGEAFANLKYQAYAEKAAADGHPELAKLFAEIGQYRGQRAFRPRGRCFGLGWYRQR